MSIHKSKGLEFPVVFVAELNSKFNKTDSYGDCLIDDDCGLGLQIIESNVKLPAAAHEVIAEKKLNTMLAEEMRILYVAITRAREKLILTASKKTPHCRNILAPLTLLPAEPVRDWQLTGAKCHFDWLLYALANHKKLQDLFELKSTRDSIDDNLFDARLIDLARLNKISNAIIQKKYTRLKQPVSKTVKTTNQTRRLLDRVRESLNWKYPFEDLTKLQAKTSVSKLTHPSDEFADVDFSHVFDRRPEAVSKEKTDNKLIGTATHLVIQNLNLAEDITIDSIKVAIDKLMSENKFSAEVAQKIDCDSILRFFDSDLGKLVTEHKDDVLREWPFTFGADAAQLGATSAGQTVIVQGIIDMIIPTDAGLVIIDFKTDDATADSAENCAKARGYYEQMRHYATAASKILKQTTKGTFLYFLTPGISIDIPFCHSD